MTDSTVASSVQSWLSWFPLSRDQAILLLVAVNQFFLSLDTYLVHAANGTIRPREAIPIWFGLSAAVLLLVCGLIAIKFRDAAATIAAFVFIASVLVGILGVYFHFVRGTLPTAPAGSRVTLDLLIWAPPFLAPLAFAGVGLIGMSAALVETPPESGRLRFFRRHVQLPFSKSKAYYFYVALGILVAVISATLDHARHWEDGVLWLPTIVGLFATFVAFGVGMIPQLSRHDVQTFAATMVILILTGLIGLYFHIQADLTAQGTFVLERFLRGAPVLAPLLYANMGLIGLAVLLPEK